MESFFPTPRDLLDRFETDTVMMAVINRIWGRVTGRAFGWKRRDFNLHLQKSQVFFCVADLARKRSFAESTIKDKLAKLRSLGRIVWQIVKHPVSRQIEGLIITVLEPAAAPPPPARESVAASVAATSEENLGFQDFPDLSDPNPSRLPSTKRYELKREQQEHSNPNPTQTRASAPVGNEPLPQVDVGLEKEIELLAAEIQEACPHLDPTAIDRANFRDQMVCEFMNNGSLDKQRRGLRQLQQDPVLAAATEKLTRVSHMAEALRSNEVNQRRANEFRYARESLYSGASPSEVVAELAKGIAGAYHRVDPRRLVDYCQRLVATFAK